MKPIRYPQLKGKTEAQQIRELESYLRYLAEQLNYLLKTLERSDT